MAELDHLARTSAYFDGELPEAEHADALAHLATCEECQRLLGTAVSLDAAASQRAKQVPVVDELAATRAKRRRWPVVAGSAVVLAAAAALLFWLVRPKTEPEVAVRLPAERTVTMRFTGDLYTKHRPYQPMRGTAGHEVISLEDLARLEKRGDLRNLVAALVSSGDLSRAEQVAAKLPRDAATESDLAAIAIAQHDPEAALLHAYRALDRDANLVAAWWNLALVARDLGLPRVAKEAFEHVIERGEAGWREEAKSELAPIERQIADEDLKDIEERGKAMLAGGPPLTTADVDRAPARTRLLFHDALSVATSKADAERLRPLAQALDVASKLSTANAALDRVLALDFTVRAKVAARYRAMIDRTATNKEVDETIAELGKLGAPVVDIYVNALLVMNRGPRHADELVALTKGWNDPWFELVIERDRIAATYPENDLRAEPALIAALARCTNPAFSLRCGQLGFALTARLVTSGQFEEAEVRMRAALDAFARAHSRGHYRTARTFLADIHRRRGRFALGRAELQEEILAAHQAGACDRARYSEIGRANILFMSRELTSVRALLPPAKPPANCQQTNEVIGLVTAVDLSRITNDPRDREVARTWIEEVRATAPSAAIVAAARIEPVEPAAIAALREWLAKREAGYVADALRVLAYSTLISEAGARGAWSEVIDAAKQEIAFAGETSCVMVTSLDDDRFTVAAQVDGQLVGEIKAVPAPAAPTISPAITQKLAACTGVAVIGRTQTHGRADLLPPSVPWWFVGEHQARQPAVAATRSVQVIDVRPPELGVALQRLPSPPPSAKTFDLTLDGVDATPARVLGALSRATYAEIHAHGIVSAANEDAAFLALSPDANGTFALDAGMIRKAKFETSPLVVLGACRAAAVAAVFRERWSLPDAFLAAGARGVIAADEPIPDAEARAVLDEIHAAIDAGQDAATALAAIRKTRGGWTNHLMLFR